MGWLSTITNWIPGGGIVKAVSGAVSSWQDRKAAKQADKAQWELAQAKRSSSILRWATFAILWGPILHAYTLAMLGLPADPTPEHIAAAVTATLGAFPGYWTGGAMTVLLAVWGIREAGNVGITQAAMRAKEKEAEAGAERERRNRERESRGESPVPGPIGGGP